MLVSVGIEGVTILPSRFIFFLTWSPYHIKTLCHNRIIIHIE